MFMETCKILKIVCSWINQLFYGSKYILKMSLHMYMKHIGHRLNMTFINVYLYK